MFDIGLPEFFVIGLVALIVFGPERLPEMAAQFGKWVRVFRTQVGNATAELKKSTDISGLTEMASELKSFTPRNLINDTTKSASPTEVKVVFDPDAT